MHPQYVIWVNNNRAPAEMMFVNKLSDVNKRSVYNMAGSALKRLMAEYKRKLLFFGEV